MFDIFFGKRDRRCDGVSRRDFLRVGALGGLALPTPANLAVARESVKDAASREEAFQDLFWALMNTKEFSFNH